MRFANSILCKPLLGLSLSFLAFEVSEPSGDEPGPGACPAWTQGKMPGRCALVEKGSRATCREKRVTHASYQQTPGPVCQALRWALRWAPRGSDPVPAHRKPLRVWGEGEGML